MKRMYYGLLAAYLALVLCVSPGWGATHSVSTAEALVSLINGTNTSTTLSDGDIIEVTGDILTLASELKPTVKNLTLKTTSGTTLSGNEQHRVINITDVATGFTLDGFTVTKGKETEEGSFGGGLWVRNANVVVKNCNFTNNKAPNGAGIAADAKEGSASAKLTVDNCKFSNNESTAYAGGLGCWVYGSSTVEVSITNSEFTSNTATGPGAGVNAAADNECNGATLKVNIENCTFDGNTASTGGGIEHEINGTVTFGFRVSNCLFNQNKNTTNTYYGGGGIFTRVETTAQVTLDTELGYVIENCTFTENESHRGGAIRVSNRNRSSTPLYINNCTFKTNKASVSPYYGGAIHNMGYTVVTNCTFMDNTTSNTNGWGADIYNTYDSAGTETSLKLINSIFASGAKSICNDTTNSTDGTINLINCAYATGTLTDKSNGTKNITTEGINVTDLDWSSRGDPDTVTINDVTHTVYKLTADDKDLIRGGTATGAPACDQIGYTRSTSKPSIGAVEYIGSLTVSSDATLPEGTVGVEYSADLKADYDTPQTGAEFKWEEVTSGDALSGFGLKVSGDQVAGTPTKAGTYYFTLKATGSGDLYKADSAQKDFTLTINEAPVVTSSPDIGTVSITVKNAVGSSTAAFSVTSADVKLTTASNDLNAGVTIANNGKPYLLAESDATPVFSVSAGNATLKAAYMTNDDSAWTSTADLDALTITDLTAITGQEAISETSPDYYHFQFNVSDDYYFILEVLVKLSADADVVDEPVTPVTSNEPVVSGSVTDPTVQSGDEYYVPANGIDNPVTLSGDVWELPTQVEFRIFGGFSNFISNMLTIARNIRILTDPEFAPNAAGRRTKLGAALSTPVFPGTIFIIRLEMQGDRLPSDISSFAMGSARVAKVQGNAIVGAMAVQNEKTSGDKDEKIDTLKIDTTDLREPDDTTKKVAVPQGKYAVSYSTLNGQIQGAFTDDFEIEAANYTPSNGDDDTDTDTDDEQETSSHGGSSGCNAGFGLFALAALALAFRKFSK